MGDNALWGFVERAANWACPLALLQLQTRAGYQPQELFAGVGRQLAPLDAYLSGYQPEQLRWFMAGALATLCLTIPVLRSRKYSLKAQ